MSVLGWSEVLAIVRNFLLEHCADVTVSAGRAGGGGEVL